jgi:hypothetical protein
LYRQGCSAGLADFYTESTDAKERQEFAARRTRTEKYGKQIPTCSCSRISPLTLSKSFQSSGRQASDEAIFKVSAKKL